MPVECFNKIFTATFPATAAVSAYLQREFQALDIAAGTEST